MSEYQEIVLKYIEENIVLKDKKILFEYDEKSVVIIDENKILHFIYIDNKIRLISPYI
ncbi:MAG: hypothetical protein KIB43_03420 [Clostridium baratii]|uniref:hypothetical protein n=1 Tax=Clostridium baratii TaxID=1561 RepID=UPI0006C248DC|nr:hypothetical protein [Clostridium baratii]MBS6005986.1 hypothetical protein [Clostridium baratii]MDU1053055.1 hypothetical protein [Clostridium baratii]MDU4911731.1 hypothetical protein [Clostridium baratii]CUP16881.1 Uncharacterised protein [Clostridium baratii]